MRRIRETLRLHLQAGLSYNEVARALKISKSVVGKYVLLARVAGVDWDTAQTLSDEDLEARLYRPAVPRASYLRISDQRDRRFRHRDRRFRERDRPFR